MEKIKKWWRQGLNYIGNYFLRIGRYYLTFEGGKTRVNLEKILISISFLTCPLLIIYFFTSSENTAYLGRSPNSLALTTPPQANSSKVDLNSNDYSYPVQENENIVGGNKTKKSFVVQPRGEIKFAAKQVVLREDGTLGYGFHAGSNLIGELQSTIDTRDPSQIVRVVLPYGGRSRDGNAEIPRGTLLMGQVSYQGKGKKVFIQFQQAILPEGKAIKISAIALDPKDYSTGLIGEIQSQAKSRTLSVMGLSALSAMGNVMTEKESLGLYNVEAKANARNALLAGASKAAEVEASRLQEQTEMQDFVQVDAGTAVVVSLTQGLNL